MPDRILRIERVIRGWFDVLKLRAVLNGEETDRLIVEHPSGSTVLAYDPVRRVAALVSETRLPVLHLGQPPLAEAVAGAVEDEDWADCARRELLEETGLRVADLEPVGRVWMTPSTTTERVHLFLAAYGEQDRVGEGGGLAEEGEHLHVREVPLTQLWRDLEAGVMFDAKTLLLLQALRLRRPDLFV